LEGGRAARSDRTSPAQRREDVASAEDGVGAATAPGEDLEEVSRSLGVTAATLAGWRDAFVAAGEAVLTTKSATSEDLESDRLKARLGAALLERDLLEEKIAILEANRPLGRRRLRP